MFIYYQVVYILLEELLPRDYGDMQLKLLMANNIMNFSLLYFSFWPSAICMLSTQVFQAASSTFVYGKEFSNEILIECIFGLLWQLFNFAIVHAIVSFVGMLYVEASILRNGNEKLLNDLKEAVIIIDQETGLVLFVNQAAKRFNIRKNKNLEVNFTKNTDENIFDKKEELFAHVDMNIFRSTKLGDSQ